MMHIEIPIDKRLACLVNASCQASPYRLTLPLSFFDAGRLQLRNVGPLFFYVISCSFCARLRRVASSTGNLEER